MASWENLPVGVAAGLGSFPLTGLAEMGGWGAGGGSGVTPGGRSRVASLPTGLNVWAPRSTHRPVHTHTHVEDMHRWARGRRPQGQGCMAPWPWAAGGHLGDGVPALGRQLRLLGGWLTLGNGHYQM